MKKFVKLKRDECLSRHPKFPVADYLREQFEFPVVFKSYFLSITPRPRTKYIKALSVAIGNLVEELGYEFLIFLGDSKTSWLYRSEENRGKSKAINEALDYFGNKNIGPRFNGALRLDVTEVGEFTEHLYWLTSPNAALPIFHFMDGSENILGSICQYGTVHFNTLNSGTDSRFNKLICHGMLPFLLSSNCDKAFGK
jgi:hypothetical protein